MIPSKSSATDSLFKAVIADENCHECGKPLHKRPAFEYSCIMPNKTKRRHVWCNSCQQIMTLLEKETENNVLLGHVYRTIERHNLLNTFPYSLWVQMYERHNVNRIMENVK